MDCLGISTFIVNHDLKRLNTTLHINSQEYTIDICKPLDISIPLRASKENPTAWYLDQPTREPVIDGNWIGAVQEGAAVNFNTINFNPHAHGTHTECVGHITKEFYSVHDVFSRFFFTAELVTIAPQKERGDLLITQASLSKALGDKRPEAIVIRTLPNSEEKLSKQHSHTNWAYLTKDAAQYLCRIGIQHLLIDTPSVDKEKDDGALLAHKAFWNIDSQMRLHATITEFIFASEVILDGEYILELQVANMVNDAAPSRPILYEILN